MKRIISIVLTFALFLSLASFGVISSAADVVYTKLDVKDYGIRHLIPSMTNKDSGNYTYGLTRPAADTADYMQSYTSMTQIGFSDKTNIPYVAFLVEAPADGSYIISPLYTMQKLDTFSPYSLTVGINDNEFYKCPEVTAKGSQTPRIEVSLKKGVNVVRLITMTAENYSLFANTILEVWFFGLSVENTLNGVAPNNELTLYPAKTSKHINLYNTVDTSTGSLGFVDMTAASSAGLTYDNLDSTNITSMPYYSYTINAPYNGYYDMSAEVYTGLLGEQGYLTVFVDETKYKCNFIDIKEWYTKAAICVYIPKGTHSITVTAALDMTSNFYNDWCDMYTFKISGGATLSDVQIMPLDLGASSIYSNSIYKHNFDIFNEGEYIAATDGVCIDTSLNFAPTQKNDYAAFALKAQSDGIYNFSIEALYKISESKGVTPTSTIYVNGSYYKTNVTTYNKLGTITYKDIPLKNGINIVYLLGADLNLYTTFDNNITIGYGKIYIPSNLELITDYIYSAGDTNSDTYFNLKDLLRTKKYLADSTLECSTAAADLNFDDIVDASDITVIKQMLLRPDDITLPNVNELLCDIDKMASDEIPENTVVMPKKLSFSSGSISLPEGSIGSPKGELADPHIFKDDDGKLYLYIAANNGYINIYTADNITDTWVCVGRVGKVSGRNAAWAPCMYKQDGKYYLYLSNASTADYTTNSNWLYEQQLYVLSSNSPISGFSNGKILYSGTSREEDFTIDPHVVKDSTGKLLIYYAADVKTGNRIGTRIFVDELTTPTTPANNPKEVVSPTLDQEISRYDNGVPWHTVEGPFYFEKDGWRYLMYSGSQYQDENYHIGYASAKIGDSTNAYTATFTKHTLNGVFDPLMKSNANEVSTGHNSVVLIDGTYYMFYHGRDTVNDLRTIRVCKLNVGGGKITAETLE